MGSQFRSQFLLLGLAEEGHRDRGVAKKLCDLTELVGPWWIASSFNPATVPIRTIA